MVGVSANLRLETDDPEQLFSQVDRHLGNGQGVLAYCPVLVPLLDAYGIREDGKAWFDFSQRGPSVSPIMKTADTVISALALLLLLPVLVVIAVLVKRSSPGPVFFKSEVIGYQKRPFVWFKFRSMYVRPKVEEERRKSFEAYAKEKVPKKVIDNSSVTPVGRFLRRFSLDELPQLFNVLKGEMSLVGPRPCLAYETELFPTWAQRRFRVKPGLTGIWQVYGRSRVPFEEGLAMDVFYTYGRSFGLYLSLIMKTFGVMVTGRGGY